MKKIFLMFILFAFVQIIYASSPPGHIEVNSGSHELKDHDSSQCPTFIITKNVIGSRAYLSTFPSNLPGKIIWNLGDGSYVQGDSVIHDYNPGTYSVVASYVSYDSACTYFQMEFVYIDSIITDSVPCPDLVINKYTDGAKAYLIAAPTSLPGHYFWHLGDGTTAAGDSIFHTYSKSGTYVVRLYYESNDSSCTTTQVDTVEIKENICTDIKYTYVKPTNYKVVFTASQTGLPGNYFWDFGAGYSGYGDSIEYYYNFPGKYIVKLQYSDSINNCYSTYVDTISVEANNCKFINFTYARTLNTFHFWVNEDHYLPYLTWNFGDGSTGQGYDISHTYKTPGIYWVSLTFSTPDSICTSVYHERIEVLEIPCPKVTITKHINDSTIIFVANPSELPGNYFWDLGDGNHLEGDTIIYTYKNPGIYNVNLAYQSYDSTCIVSASDTITIKGTECPDISYTAHKVFNNHYIFLAQPFGLDGFYYWDFGDGNWAWGDSTSHRYPMPGKYIATLYYNSYDSTCITSYSDTINISIPECPTITTNLHQAKNSIYLSAVGGDSTDLYTWNFGDGNTGAGMSVQHTYWNPGIYAITLTYKNAIGCTSTSYFNVFIDSINCPTIFFSKSVNESTVSLVAENNNANGYHFWNLGDGNIAWGDTVTHTFNNPGLYHITLNYQSYDSLCFITFTDTIYISKDTIDCPDVTFTKSFNKATVSYTAQNSAPNGFYFWNLGDGTTAWGESVEHTYQASGIYQVTLNYQSYDSLCFSTYQDTVNILIEECEIDFNYHNLTNTIYLFNAINETSQSGTYSWSFGDGTTGNGILAYHVYNNPGTYKVTLSFTSHDKTCTSEEVQYIQIGPETCSAGFHSNLNDNSGGNIYNFVALDSSEMTFHIWKINERIVSFDPEFSYQFEAGTYEVTLKIITLTGCTSETTQVLFIPEPLCSISIGKIVIGNIVNLQANIQNTSSGTSYEWDFNDGSKMNGNSVRHVYAKPGSYIITLNYHNSDWSCYGSIVDTVTVKYNIKQVYSISGNVFAGNTPVTTTKVTLYKQINNVFEPIQFKQEGHSYSFDNVEPGKYLVLATGDSLNSYLWQYMPTYYGDVTEQVNAKVITVKNQNISFKDIHLVKAEDSTITSTGAPVDISLIVELFPNPSSDVLNVKVNSHRSMNKECSVMIMDYIGRQMFENKYQLGNEDIEIDVRDIPTGMYLLHLNDGEKVEIKSFYITR